MSHEAVAAVTALIELGMIAQDDIVKCLKKALSEPEQQRTTEQSSRTLAWVGLTDKEAHELWESTDSDDDWELMKRTEAKLKEKNT